MPKQKSWNTCSYTVSKDSIVLNVMSLNTHICTFYMIRIHTKSVVLDQLGKTTRRSAMMYKIYHTCLGMRVYVWGNEPDGGKQ